MELSQPEGELGRLENPTLLDGLLSLTALATFWTWGFLILIAVTSALAFAAAGILLYKQRVNMVRNLSFCSSGEDDDDASVSSSDTDEDDEEETDDEMGESDEEEDESGDFGGVKVNGMGNFTFSSFSLADLVGGMGVVKAWDGAGLGLDRGRGSISFFDTSRGEVLRSFNGGAAETRGLDLVWPAEIVSAADEAGGAVVRVWDARERVEKPAATARPLLRRRIAGIRAREEKVFVGDEGGEIAAVDLRKLAQVEGGEGSGCWWRSAATCLKLLSPRLENA